MKRIFFFFLLITITIVNGQTICFNKSYIPVGNTSSVIYNIFTLDSLYWVSGISNYYYPHNVTVFRIDSFGNVINTNVYGDSSSIYYDGYDENAIKINDTIISAVTKKDYSINPNTDKSYLYFFNETDTLIVTNFSLDTMPCSVYYCAKNFNNYYVTGLKAYGIANSDHYDVVLFKTDSIGNLIWERHYGSTSMDIGYKIINTYDNKLIIASNRYGYYTSNNSYYTNDSQWWIFKLDTAGNIIWNKNFGNPNIQDGFPRGLIETADSNYIITGSYAVGMSGSAELLRGRILKINANGNVIWSKLYGEASIYTYTSLIKEAPNHNLISIYNDGWNSGYQTPYNPIIQCITPEGNIKWFRQYYFNQDIYADASVLNSFDFTSDGGYIFAGYGIDYDSVPAQRSWVIKTDSLGFDGVTDFSTDTAYRIELSLDSCYNDTALILTHTYGITAPYHITYDTYATHNNLYYSPLYEPYITDTLILTGSMVTGSDSIINIPCTVTDGLGRILHDTLTVNVGCLISGMETVAFEDDIKIYPNPATDNLTILINNFPSGQLTINNLDIFDITGQEVQSKKLKVISKKCDVNIKSLPAGIYHVKITTNKDIIIKKFVKQ